MHLPASCWKPMVAAVVMFAFAVVAIPPQPVEEPAIGCPDFGSTSEYQYTPVVLVSVDGALTYRGQDVTNLATLDALLAARVYEPVPESVPEAWKNAVIVHARANADAGRVIALSRHLEQQGYKPLYSMKD